MPVSDRDRETATQRLEDLTWMADTGESATGAATRLGLSRNGLEMWCRRHAPEVWRRLKAHDPRDPNYRSRKPSILNGRAS